MDFGQVELGPGGRGQDKMIRSANQRTRAHNFVQANYDPETVKRFEEKGNRVLEELLAEALTDEKPQSKPDIAYPNLEIAITSTAFDFTDDTRIGPHNHPPLHEECYVTLFLKIKSPRPTLVAIKTFKMILMVEGKEYVSFAEGSVFARRFVSQDGTELGEGSHHKNLSEHPPLLIEDTPIEGSLQFIFKELRYIDLLTEEISLQDSPFTLLLVDTDGEAHSAEGVLTGEGLRYVNH